MSRWPVIGVMLLGLAGLVFWWAPHDARIIQHDIMTRTTEALTAANIPIPDGALKVDGRDVTLTGVRGSAIVSDQTRDLVQNLAGVREPVHLVVTDPPPPPPAPPLPVEARNLETNLTQFLAGKTIRFDGTSDVIHPEGKAVLEQVVRILATAPKVAIDIAGHTDTDGDANFNLDLSKRRAAAVKLYLVARGIKADRLETEGFGGTKPAVPNDTPENKARNRRIEFHASARVPGAAIGK
jgi:outer membrane protein OmpA-like peptidoglycan-associated protein